MTRLIFILFALIGVSQAQTIQYIGAPTTTVISRGNFRTDSIFYLPKRTKAPTDTAAIRYQISDSSLYVWTGSQWVKAGGSGTISGSGLTGYIPQFSASTTLDTSALFTLGNRLGIGTSTFAYTSTSTANAELNGTAGGILGFKRNDSARGYLWHTGDNMELANTVAGSISFNTNSATRGSISSAGVWRLHGLAGTGDRVVQASSNGTLSATASVTGLVDTTTISTRAWRQKGIDSVVSIIPAAGVGGSGTTNYVPKFTAGTTIGNSQIFDEGTNVGIATTTPGSKLDVRSTGYNIIRSTGGNGGYFDSYNTSGTRLASFGAESSGDTYFGSRANTPLIALTNNTERLRITSQGSVLIGLTSDPLQEANRQLVSINGTNNALLAFRRNSDLSGYVYGTSSFFGVHTNNIPLTLNVGNAGQIEAMRVHNNGRIGVNTTTDAGYQLNVNGTFNSGANYSYFGGDANTAVYLGSFSTEGRIGVGGRSSFPTAAMTFYTADGTNNFERMRISSAGDVGIATTSPSYKLDINGTLRSVNGANFATTSGNVGIGTASPDTKLGVIGNIQIGNGFNFGNALTINRNVSSLNTAFVIRDSSSLDDIYALSVNATTGEVRHGADDDNATGFHTFYTASLNRGRITASGEWIIDASGTDAGDYKLQVVGNARVGTGKLDIASNTTFGLGVARSGTSEIAGQIYNSNGILYTGVESSAGGQIFTGSSAYAAVIGSGANYPLQFATNNATRATINTNGELLINTTTDNGDFKLQVNGNALISGSIKTANGGSSTAVPWHLGSVVATSVQLDTSNYVEVEINGVYYRLAIVTPL